VSTLTNVDGLNLDTLFNVSHLRIVRNLVCKHLRLAESVHEGGPTCARGTCICESAHVLRGGVHLARTDDHQGKLNTLLHLVPPASAGERHVGVKCSLA
jgi:hypothetical protein